MYCCDDTCPTIYNPVQVPPVCNITGTTRNQLCISLKQLQLMDVQLMLIVYGTLSGHHHLMVH